MTMEKIKELVKSFVCQSEYSKIFELTSLSYLKDKEIERLNGIVEVASRQYNNLLADESKTAKFWNDKWAKNKVTYTAQGFKADVRNLIFTKSHILDNYAKEISNGLSSNDEIVIKTLKEVKKLLNYKGDLETKKKTEFWQSPDETFQSKTGDCEDGALLLISLLRIIGIPAYRIKLCAGYVKNGDGHAYAIYLADDDNWYTLDWCYFGNESINNFKKKPHKDNTNYGKIWWTANDKYTWAQNNTDADKI